MQTTRKIFPILMIVGLFFSLISTTQIARADDGGSFDPQAVDAFLSEQVKANRIPGLAIAMVKNNQVVLLKGYGEAAPGVPVTPQTQFYIGSVTKSFTALAVMQLVEQGKLELDAPVQQYLPWFKVAEEQASAQITVRNLLNHTSGLSEKGDPNASAYTASLDEQGRLLSEVHPTAPVGAQFQYYNQNYRLLGRLIEEVSGQSYADYMHANVFEPLGMLHTATNPAEAPNLAQGYSRFFGFPLRQSQMYSPGRVPSGLMITTAEDMANFLIAQLNNTRSDGSAMLSSQWLAEMRTPPAGIDSEYGMGWLVAENGNVLAHGGAIEYFHAFIAMRLDEKTGFAILCNQDSMLSLLTDGEVMQDGLMNMMLGETPQRTTYGWVGWVLLALAALDLLNHLRLFAMLPRWVEKTARQPRTWLWIKVILGILIPLLILFGVPLLVKSMEGGSPTWMEGFSLMPDLVSWLLVGVCLNLVRSLLHAFALVRVPTRQ